MPHRMLLILSLCAASAWADSADSIDPAKIPPRSPAETLKSIHVPEGFRVELVAAEPDVLDPVAIAWGADGRLWVAEMADYPTGLDGRGQPGGRVRYLEDADGDGRYEKSVVFAEGLAFPNGVTPWRDGVLVTAAPDILYLPDADGDGRADKIDPLYSGFGEGNQQLRVNGLRYGLDGWLYGANGWSGGKVKSVKTGAVLDLGGRGGPDFRIHPETGAIEPTTGTTQYGRVRDDWGNWFGCDNSHLIWHVTLPERYTRRNPDVTYPPARRQLVLPKNPPVFPASRLRQRMHADYMANRFTSACGLSIYRDDILFDRAATMSFTCEPVHNCVSRRVLSRDGASFRAERAASEAKKEFFASEDHWCRPVQTRTGPDGALYVVDMYRWMVEHPQWVPKQNWEAWKDRIDVRAGHDRGRIYRVVRTDRPVRAVPKLKGLTPEKLIDALEHPNGVIRDLTQRELLQQPPDEIAGGLRSAAASQPPLGRLTALATLGAIGRADAAVLKRALADARPDVRRYAVQLAGESPEADAALIDAVAVLARDADAAVRQQVAFTLGAWRGERADGLLKAMAQRESDPLLVAALLSSAQGRASVLLEGALDRAEPDGELIENLAKSVAASGDKGAVRHIAQRAASGLETAPAAWRFRAALGLLQGDRKAWPSAEAPFEKLRTAARSLAVSASAPAETRRAATELLGVAPNPGDADRNLLARTLDPKTPSEIQSAAITALRRLGGSPEPLLGAWPALLPDVRSAATDALISRDAWRDALLEAVRSGRIPARQIDASRRERLARHKDPAVRAAAQKAFGDLGGDRAKVVESHRDVLSLPADAARGKAVFARACAACHRLDGVGQPIGPDLRSVTDRSPEGLLTAILDPNRGVEPRYFAYTVVLNDGTSAFGLIVEQSGGSITVQGLDGQKQTVRRADIALLQSLDRSLMPDGLEAAMSKQELADLIRYLGYPGAQTRPSHDRR